MPSAFTTSPEVHKFSLRVGAWNVRTLNDSDSDLSLQGKGIHLVRELERYGIDICCLSEVKWLGHGHADLKDWSLAFSGSTSIRQRGVGVLLSPQLKASLIDTYFISDRLMSCVLRLGKIKLHVVAVYAPTEDKSEVEKENFYAALQAYADSVPWRDKLIIAGDFNAQLGGQDRHAWSGALGKFCLGKKATDNGSRLLTFCASNEIVVRSTFFQQKDIHLATWVSPSGMANNQIDHVLVRRRDAKHVCNCRVMRGSSFQSDHYLLRAQCRFPGKFRPKPFQSRPRLNAQLLHDREVKKAFDCHMQQAFQDSHVADPLCQWEAFKSAAQSAQGSLLMQYEEQSIHTWLSPETLQLIAQKRIAWQRVVNEKKRAQAPTHHSGEKNEPRPRAKRNEHGPQGGVGPPSCEKNEGCKKWCRPHRTGVRATCLCAGGARDLACPQR